MSLTKNGKLAQFSTKFFVVTLKNIFLKNSIRECLSNRSLCPLCKRQVYISQILPLFITTDDETDKLVQDLQLHIGKKSEEIDLLKNQTRNETKGLKSIITSKENEIKKHKLDIESKQKELEKLQNDYKVMRISVTSKQTTLDTLKETCVTLKAEKEEKIKQIEKLTEELEESKQSTCDLDKYEQSKLKYRSLLNRFEKLADENVAVKKSLETLQEKSLAGETSNSQNGNDVEIKELKEQIEKLNQENQVLKDNKGDKAKYNKLLDSFERLVDEKSAIAHEKLRLEKFMEENDVSKMKQELSDCLLKLSNTNNTLTATKQECDEFKKQNILLTASSKKTEELTKTNQKLQEELNVARKAVSELTKSNSKLSSEKDNALKNSKAYKNKPSNTNKDNTATNVVDLDVSSVPESKILSLESELKELKTSRNRLIRESNKNKARGDNLVAENRKLFLKTVSLNEMIEKLKQELKTKQELNKKQNGSKALSKEQQEELIHQ